MKSAPYSHIVITLLLFLIAANLLILDLKVFTKAPSISQITTITISPTPTITSPLTTNQSCPQSCIALFSETVKTPPSLPTTSTTSPAGGSTSSTLTNIERELYIPLGSGTTSRSDWDDLTTTDTLIDTSKYGTIKEVFFTVILKNPSQSGDSQARLYNVTDKHPVWSSEVKMEGPTSQQITSSKITLDTGNKLYRVQAKSGLSTQITIDTAKLRLITYE